MNEDRMLGIYQEVQDAIAPVDSLLKRGAAVRKRHRRKTKPGNPKRNADLLEVIGDISGAMLAIRSLQGRKQFQEFTSTEEQRLRKASRALQQERRQLRGMLR